MQRSVSNPERKLRARKIAQRLAKLYPDATVFLAHRTPWELLVATILSAQCTDKKVNEVTAKLFKKYRTLNEYVRANPREFERAIHSTGFYRAKTKHILATAKLVKEKYGGKVPDTMEALLTLPGVARKTANIVLQNAYGIVVGIPVDTHVQRLSKTLGLSDASDPVKIERDLMELFPKREWLRLSYRLISYGREYCPARPHDHDHCPLTPQTTNSTKRTTTRRKRNLAIAQA